MDETDRTLHDESPPTMGESPTILAERYQLRGVLGRGGMGVVYRAEDLELGELIALKVVARGDSCSREAGLSQQREEVRLARRVTHPNVARTYDLGEANGLRFITMELVDGASLRHVIGGSASVEERLSLVAQVAAGLDAIHEAGIAHRDLKPDNVLVSASGVAKITDFGIARLAGSLAEGMATGTPRYMAPEVLGGAAPTPAADVYAFGLVALETLTGERFRGGDRGPAEAALRAVLGDAQAEVTSFLVDCLAESPAERPRSVRPLASRAAREPLAPHVRAFAPRVRMAAHVFVASASAGWLSDSLPAEILKHLTRSNGLEVRTALMPADPTVASARAAGVDIVVAGSVDLVAEGIRLSVRAVSCADEIALWARTTTISMTELASGLRRIADDVSMALLGDARLDGDEATRVQDPRVTELLLRASHADHDPWRDFNDDAVALAEQAVALAPHDPYALALLAMMLLRGAGPYDAARYDRARRAAESAVALDPSSVDSQLALALVLFIGNDTLGAITPLRSVLRGAPSLADGHAVLSTIALDVGLLRDAVGRATLALALDPGIAIVRASAALAHEYLGEPDRADEVVESGLRGESPLGRVLCVLYGVRLALWRGTPDARRSFLERVVPFRGTPVVEPLASFLEGGIELEELLQELGPLASSTPQWARQTSLRMQFECEVLEHLGRHEEAAHKLEAVAALGTCDASWMRSASVTRLAARVDLTSTRARVEARAEDVRHALASAGLTGNARTRLGR